MKNHSTREHHLDTSWQQNEHQYPDPPDNPEFDLFDEAFQERIAQRFGIGILRAEQGNSLAAFRLDATIAHNIYTQKERAKEAALYDIGFPVLKTDHPEKVTNAAKRRTRRAGGVR